MQDFQPSLILHTPDALNTQGYQVLDHFPDAQVQEIKQHNRLPETDLSHYKAKSDLLVLGRLKTRECKWSGRSSDYIAPSLANGCFGGCTYCYVDRHKKINPITLFTNIDEILETVDRHVAALPWPKPPDQTDPVYWLYDIGCNSDVSVDYSISDSIGQAFRFYRDHPRAKATFATKFVNRDLLSFDPQQKIRIRFSLMPSKVSKLVDVRTDPVEKRLEAINDFYDAGYEVHVNFSPVILYHQVNGSFRDWEEDYRELFRQLDAATRGDVQKQMKCEVIFLTHNAGQHLDNLAINPKAEELLWAPELQETKQSQFGGVNIRYEHRLKSQMMDRFVGLLKEEIPWCGVRYIF